jgi:N-acetylneuraminate synthase
VINRDIFDELFVLELANNHWGDVNRGLRIVKEFSTVVRYNDVRAAIKLQFRDVDNFVHGDFRCRTDIRYVKKTLDTRLTRDEQATLVEAIRRNNCIRMATPFDEASVDLCEDLGIEIIKIASSDITDWPLLERIARARRPVIVSTGGASVRSMDAMVTFFENRHIPLAINHCVSLYPSEDADLELNQIDYLKHRYPTVTIGFSTHEYNDWRSSIMMAYAKGARTFERHIDLDTPDHPISPYCSTPEQIVEWFQAFHKAREMCGGSATERRRLPRAETAYLDSLVRGVYAKRDLPAGHVLSEEDFYLAIPLQRGQLSCRELITGDPLVAPVFKDEPITVELFDNPYARPGFLHQTILERGIARCGPDMNVPPGRVVGGIAGDIQRPIPRVVDRGGTAEAALGAAPAE